MAFPWFHYGFSIIVKAHGVFPLFCPPAAAVPAPLPLTFGPGRGQSFHQGVEVAQAMEIDDGLILAMIQLVGEWTFFPRVIRQMS